MTIKELRTAVHMSQSQFSRYFGIPVGTLRNWEQGIAKPPEYVFSMIARILGRDSMINIETIILMKFISELAELSKNGIADFEEATEEDVDSKVFYDSSRPDENGHYPVVLDNLIDIAHHDAISFYDFKGRGDYTIRVVIDEDEKPYIDIRFGMNETEIVIEDGEWYFANID